MIDKEKLLSGDRRTLSKAITLIESSRDQDSDKAQELLKSLLPHTGKSFRLGITGAPGVGKSTFIESFGLHLISRGHKVAVLAIDPSSPSSGGSILGDKTRMEKLAIEENAFIRPSPSGGTLGGVAQKTRETMLLCEAAGYDFILVETVGVGQSEYQVANMVDFFLLFILPNGGDELQGIKKGILELADTIMINKADGDSLKLAKQTQTQYQSALSITQQKDFWRTEVLTNSSTDNCDFELVYKTLKRFQEIAQSNQQWEKKRKRQLSDWFQTLIKEMFLKNILKNEETKNLFNTSLTQIESLETTPLEAVSLIEKKVFKSKN